MLPLKLLASAARLAEPMLLSVSVDTPAAAQASENAPKSMFSFENAFLSLPPMSSSAAWIWLAALTVEAAPSSIETPHPSRSSTMERAVPS